MQDRFRDWLIRSGASGSEIHSINDKFAYACRIFGLINPGLPKFAVKKIIKRLNDQLEPGEDVSEEAFVSSALVALSSFSKGKWDVDHIAFCRSKKFYQSSRWKNLRVRALGSRPYCKACGKKASDGVILHVDHIFPRSIYPELALKESNLQVLCEDCNIGKGNTYIKRFK